MVSNQLDFNSLVTAIQNTHDTFAAQAVKAVNICLTIRNWLIGYYIDEYELQGADRPAYGDSLYNTLSEKLSQTSLKRMDARELRRFRQFYLCYPQIRETLSPILATLPLASKISLPEIWETVSPKLQPNDSKDLSILNGRLLIERLSFSHFMELMQLELSLKRSLRAMESRRRGRVVPGSLRAGCFSEGKI